MMRSDYPETLWEHIVNGCWPWTAKSPFLGKKKGMRALRIATKAVVSVVGFESTLVLGQNG